MLSPPLSARRGLCPLPQHRRGTDEPNALRAIWSFGRRRQPPEPRGVGHGHPHPDPRLLVQGRSDLHPWLLGRQVATRSGRPALPTRGAAAGRLHRVDRGRLAARLLQYVDSECFFCPPPPASKAGPGVFRPRHMEHAQGHVQDLARCHLYRAPATRRHKPQLPSQLLGRRDSCNFFRRECVAAAAGGCEHPRHKEGPR